MRLHQNIQRRERVVGFSNIGGHSNGARVDFPSFPFGPSERFGHGGFEAWVRGDGVVGVEAVFRIDEGDEGIDETVGFFGWVSEEGIGGCEQGG